MKRQLNTPVAYRQYARHFATNVSNSSACPNSSGTRVNHLAQSFILLSSSMNQLFVSVRYSQSTNVYRPSCGFLLLLAVSGCFIDCTISMARSCRSMGTTILFGITLMRSAMSPRKPRIWVRKAPTDTALRLAVVRLSNPDATLAPLVVVCESLHRATASLLT